jgi:hypothetical protein
MRADSSIYLWLGVIVGLGATILRVYSHGFSLSILTRVFQRRLPGSANITPVPAHLGCFAAGAHAPSCVTLFYTCPPPPSLRASSQPLASSLLIFAQDCPFPGAVACRPPGLRGGRSCLCSPPCWPPAPRPVRRPRSRARSSAGNLRLNASTTLYQKIFTFSLECALSGFPHE